MLPLKAYSKTFGPIRNHLGLVTWSKTLVGFRQKPPYDVDTQLDSYTYKLLSGTWANADDWSWNDDSNRGGCLTAARNKARAKFVGKLGDSSSFGATATAERKETWQTVVMLITKAGVAAKQVSRLDFLGAARTLGLPFRERTVTRVRYRRGGDAVIYVNGKPKRRGRRYVSRQRQMNWGQGWYLKTAANGWLLWSYGVKPLMQDIYNGMDVLQRPMPESRVRGSGRAKTVESRYSGGTYWVRYTYEFEASIRCSADVRVNNPNLWLCNQLGLINPVQWINEAIPFSFVVDWFSNLSQVISQMTDFVGLEISHPLTTQLCTCRETKTNYDVPYNYVKEAKIFRRVISIPTAKLQFAYERFEWQRGLNAISLLIGFLPKR